MYAVGVVVFILVSIICVGAVIYMWCRRRNKTLMKNFVQLGNQENDDNDKGVIQNSYIKGTENIVDVETEGKGENEVVVNTPKNSLQETLR